MNYTPPTSPTYSQNPSNSPPPQSTQRRLQQSKAQHSFTHYLAVSSAINYPISWVRCKCYMYNCVRDVRARLPSSGLKFVSSSSSPSFFFFFLLLLPPSISACQPTTCTRLPNPDSCFTPRYAVPRFLPSTHPFVSQVTPTPTALQRSHFQHQNAQPRIYKQRRKHGVS